MILDTSLWVYIALKMQGAHYPRDNYIYTRTHTHTRQKANCKTENYNSNINHHVKYFFKEQ